LVFLVGFVMAAKANRSILRTTMAGDWCIALAAEDEGSGVDQPSRLANGLAELVVANDRDMLRRPLLVSQGFGGFMTGVVEAWVGALARIAFTVRAAAAFEFLAHDFSLQRIFR
jgi:hypothetical protein